MHSQHDSNWERELTRELKSLPELAAPAALAEQVLMRIRRDAVRPWYRTPWQDWSRAGQAASFALLFGIFAAVTFGAWQLYEGPMVAAAMSQLEASLAKATALWHTITVLGGAAVLVVRNIHPIWLAIAAVIACVSYLLCIGAGTAAVRLVRGRRRGFRNED